MRTTETRRRERGITIPFLAIAMVALLTFTGLVVDGSNAFAQRRQMQNAADSSALAGANALNRYSIGTGTATAIHAAALSEATSNGADPASFTCTLVRSGGGTQACPTATNGLTVPSDAFRVRTQTSQTHDTLFMRVIGNDEFSASASAAAAVQRVTGGTAPFMVCALGQAPEPNLLDNSNPAVPIDDWPINAAAIGRTYNVWGNDIKAHDCGNPSSSFRGLVDEGNGPYELPGDWESRTGNKNGPTLALIGSGTPCDANYTVGCVMVLPLCPTGNDSGGSNFEMHCTRMGAFEVTHVSNHDLDAIFRGGVTLADGPAGGDPVSGEARVVRLVE
jgi:Flp pilus assembly protein TadG